MASTRANIRALALLAESEAWLIPHEHCDTHPLIVGFYVPAHLAAEARELFNVRPTPPPSRPSRMHVLKGEA